MLTCAFTCIIPLPAWSSDPPVLEARMPPVFHAVLGEPLVLHCQYVYHNYEYGVWWENNQDQPISGETDSSLFCVSQTGDRGKAKRDV